MSKKKSQKHLKKQLEASQLVLGIMLWHQPGHKFTFTKGTRDALPEGVNVMKSIGADGLTLEAVPMTPTMADQTENLTVLG